MFHRLKNGLTILITDCNPDQKPTKRVSSKRNTKLNCLQLGSLRFLIFRPFGTVDLCCSRYVRSRHPSQGCGTWPKANPNWYPRNFSWRGRSYHPEQLRLKGNGICCFVALTQTLIFYWFARHGWSLWWVRVLVNLSLFLQTLMYWQIW